MRVISPIDNLAECQMLLDAGADELYGGYVSPAWQEKFSLLTSINQRTFASAQISSSDDLIAILDKIHAGEKTFSLTLNAPFYSDDQLSMIVDYVGEVVAAGIDGIILADLSLLRCLKLNFPDVAFHASTLAHIGNSLAAEVYRDAGVNRMILPRHIPVGEISAIVKACPEAQFDAFLLIGKCPNTEGLCTFHHSSPDRIWPCEIPYEISPVTGEISPEMKRAIAGQLSWSETNRRHGCGLCAIPHLLTAGISGIKLVGRGAPTAQKVANMKLVQEFVDLADSEDDFDRYRDLAIRAHNKRFGTPCSPNVCYYPEFYQSE